MRHVKVAIIGAGTAGLTAMGIIRRETDDFVMINEGWYGTTCARVGCMPSKVLVQIADDYDRLNKLAVQGIQGADRISIDAEQVMKRVRTLRDAFVEKTLAPTNQLPAEKNLNGRAEFTGPNSLRIMFPDGRHEDLHADKILIATGSHPVLPAAWQALGDRVITSEQFFELDTLPRRVAVIGLGVIGLELGQAMARLGVSVVGLEMSETIAGITDPDVRAKAVELIGHDFPMHLNTAAELKQGPEAITVTAGDQDYAVDLVLTAIGRAPNLSGLVLANAGVPVNDRGVPAFDPATLNIPDTDIYLAGDATGEKAILHEAADEGRIAAYNIIATLQGNASTAYGERTPLALAFTHPNIAFFGQRFSELDLSQTAVGSYNFNMLGRPRVMQESEGLIRLYADKTSKRLVGGEMIAPRGEHLSHQLAWVTQLKVEVADILRLPFYHPNLEEGVRLALRELAKQLYDEMPVEVVTG